MRVGKLKNGKTATKDEITGELMRGGGARVVDWISRPRNMVLIDLLGHITRLADHAVQYSRGARDLIIGHVGERTTSESAQSVAV